MKKEKVPEPRRYSRIVLTELQTCRGCGQDLEPGSKAFRENQAPYSVLCPPCGRRENERLRAEHAPGRSRMSDYSRRQPANPVPSRSLRVALYARVSLEKDPDDPRAQDPENQLIPLREYAESENLEVYNEYEDEISGARRSRPALDQLLRDARGHRFSAVLATRVDRFSRSPLDCYLLQKELYDRGVGVRFIEQPEASTDTAQGELVLGILVHYAQFERRSISDRTKAGILRYRRENGSWGRPRSDVNVPQVRTRLKMGMRLEDIAEEFEVSEQTLRRRLREDDKKGSPDSRRSSAGNRGASKTPVFGAREM